MALEIRRYRDARGAEPFTEWLVALRDRSAKARILARLKSEHVGRVIDVGQFDNGAPYMVMEFLEGMDLANYVMRVGPLTVPQACDFVLQACEAIAEAHQVGIVHRDLKPANLYLATRADGTPLIKVLDFGISKAAPDDTNFSLTRTTTVARMSFGRMGGLVRAMATTRYPRR